MPKKETPINLLEQQSYDADELKQLYGIDKGRFFDWLNNGPLNLLSQGLRNCNAPIYPNESPLSKISNSIGASAKLIELPDMGLSPDTKKAALLTIVQLIPGLSQMEFEVNSGKVDLSKIKLKNAPIDMDLVSSSFREICRYDRSVTVYPNLVESTGHNKLARIALVASPKFLKLLNDLDAAKKQELLTKIMRGQIPPQLISNEELSRVEAYNVWLKNDRRGAEPQKPARTIWADAIRGQIGSKPINYAGVGKKIKTLYDNHVATHLYGKHYYMIDVIEEKNDMKDIPQLHWDTGSVIG